MLDVTEEQQHILDKLSIDEVREKFPDLYAIIEEYDRQQKDYRPRPKGCGYKFVVSNKHIRED